MLSKTARTVLLLTAAASPALAQTQRAEVGESLKNDPAYARYASFLIQIDMLANADLAHLPVVIEAGKPGILELSGTVPNENYREYLVENARRISGLLVKHSLRIGKVPDEFIIDMPASKLEKMTAETIESLFPDNADAIKATVAVDNEIVLTGTVSSYETKLLLSQTVKSQPGCRSVVNLLTVQPTSTGELAVSADADQRLASTSLPKIPPARGFEKHAVATTKKPPVEGAAPMLADDAPQGDMLDRQIREDALNLIRKESSLSSARLEIDVQHGVVTVQGKIKDRNQAKALVDALGQMPEASKIVAKCEPISAQRNLPRKKKDEQPKAEPKKLLGFIPNLFSKSDAPSYTTWRSRESIRKSINRQCEKRIKNLKVSTSLDGLLIEADVATARDRTFVLGQIDKQVQLFAVPYTAMIRIEQSTR